MNKDIFNTENPGVYIIAELSANHEQNIQIALDSIKAIKDTGADAVKIQTFTPDSITLDSDKPWFQTRKDSLWAGQKLYDLYKKAFTPYEWHKPLQEEAEKYGLDFFSSPFDFEGVDLLESLNVPLYKIASLEINDIPLIEKVAKTGKPIILSTGIANTDDIALAIETCRKVGNNNIAVLKCTSAYPTPMEDVNISAIKTISQKFNVIAGLSDHSLGIEIPVLSVAYGAKIIEKHFILDKENSNSVDKDFSLDKNEFTQMVTAVRNAEKAIGNGKIELTEKMKSAKSSARSLFATCNINKGETFTAKNIKSLRPNRGLQPIHLTEILGKTAMTNIEKGTPISWDLIK